MLPPTSLNVLLLLLLFHSPPTLTQTTTDSPTHPHASAISAALKPNDLPLPSSLLANPTYTSLTALLAKQTLPTATNAEIPFITELPTEYRKYAEAMSSAAAERVNSEDARASSVVHSEIGTVGVGGGGGGRKGHGREKGGDKGYGYGYHGTGTGTGTAVHTGTVVGGGAGSGRVVGGAVATATGTATRGGGAAANGTVTGSTTGMTTAPATSPPAGQPKGSGAVGMREWGIGAWCAGMLGMGVGVMMMM